MKKKYTKLINYFSQMLHEMAEEMIIKLSIADRISTRERNRLEERIDKLKEEQYYLLNHIEALERQVCDLINAKINAKINTIGEEKNETTRLDDDNSDRDH